MIEVVYYRHHTAEHVEVGSIEEGCRFLDSGEDDFSLASVGVFVDDEPVVYCYGPDAPTPEQAEEMLEAWRAAHQTGPEE